MVYVVCVCVSLSGGKNGVLPEVLKCCGEGLMEYLLKLFNRVWQERTVPQEWRDALIVPIPKKGDLSSCDNWRGISLLDVTGNVSTKTLQKGLLTLWCVLEKYGIPPILLSIIGSLHDGMKAEVTFIGNLTPEFEVCNGLRHGYVIALSLFNLCFNLVISQWQKKGADFGVNTLYKCGGKLIGERTLKPDKLKISKLLFADDAAALDTIYAGGADFSLGDCYSTYQRSSFWSLALPTVRICNPCSWLEGVWIV